MVDRLITEGYFKNRQTAAALIAHCRAALAHTYEPNEISITLSRAIRNGKLKREKNAEDQYEYYTS